MCTDPDKASAGQILRLLSLLFARAIPEHREGEVRAELECDGKSIGYLTLRYNCEMEKINGLIQVG